MTSVTCYVSKSSFVLLDLGPEHLVRLTSAHHTVSDSVFCPICFVTVFPYIDTRVHGAFRERERERVEKRRGELDLEDTQPSKCYLDMQDGCPPNQSRKSSQISQIGQEY